jgi:D-hexose-6-phosphate mutarotase
MSDQKNLTCLNNQFGIPGQLQFSIGHGGLIVAEVTNNQCEASIALQGAQLLSWIPEGQQPVIWLSEEARFIAGKSVGGGIPVCWPWFGAHPQHKDYPSHGFARTSDWHVIETNALNSDQTEIKLRLSPQDMPQNNHAELFPYNTSLELHISIGTRLEMRLVSYNLGDQAISISQALHSYFVVSDIGKVTIKGLEDCEFIDALDQWTHKAESNPVTINAEIDRIYQGTTPSCLIEDPGFKRQIKITTQGSRSTVVWNPWVEKSLRLGDMGQDGYLKMLCVESGNIADDSVSIAAGEEYCLSVCYEIESL